MKSLLCAALCVLVAAAPLAAQARADVRGYTTKSGTTVAPHQRTAPDLTKGNNWSTKGNVNPNTGKKGTKPATPTVRSPRISKSPAVRSRARSPRISVPKSSASHRRR